METIRSLSRIYKIRKFEESHLLERHIFPKMQAEIDFSVPVPELKHIKFFEDCSTSLMKNVIDEIGYYINENFVNEFEDSY
jgi:hypothetical protein